MISDNAFVRLFQTKAGLSSDGIAGDNTLNALDRVRFDSKPEGKPVSVPPAVIQLPGSTTSGAMLYQSNARYPIHEIVVHCAATRPEWYANKTLSQKRTEIRRWHIEDRGFKDIGYHWLIDRDGKSVAGRTETTIGAHVLEANRGTIGICLIGGYESTTNDLFRENYTEAQDTALRVLIQKISGRTQIKKITGHYQYANKACPGFNVDKWMKRN